MSLVLANALVASLSPRGLRPANVTVDGAQIGRIGQEAPSAGDTVVDLGGRLIMPGHVCAHTHVYSALARGMPGPRQTPRNFLEILERVWWRLDRALDEESIRASALNGALDAVLAGTTCLIDHHASPNAIAGSLDVIADAFSAVGIRGVLC
jgi:cytosine/adenosine deaminase-related metal-dependent hydrolase